jgi:hypothetical protein
MTGPSKQLQELFPLHSKSQIDAALNSSSGALEAAAELLLQQQPAAAAPARAASAAAAGRGNYCSPKVRLVDAGPQLCISCKLCLHTDASEP